MSKYKQELYEYESNSRYMVWTECNLKPMKSLQLIQLALNWKKRGTRLVKEDELIF